MDEATKERFRLNALHDEELRRDAKAKEQEYEYRKRMLNLEHGLNHDAAIKRTKELNMLALLHHERILELDFNHRERLLKTEHWFKLSAERAEDPGSVFGDAALGKAAEVPKKGASVASLRNVEETVIPNR